MDKQITPVGGSHYRQVGFDPIQNAVRSRNRMILILCIAFALIMGALAIIMGNMKATIDEQQEQIARYTIPTLPYGEVTESGTFLYLKGDAAPAFAIEEGDILGRMQYEIDRTTTGMSYVFWQDNSGKWWYQSLDKNAAIHEGELPTIIAPMHGAQEYVIICIAGVRLQTCTDNGQWVELSEVHSLGKKEVTKTGSNWVLVISKSGKIDERGNSEIVFRYGDVNMIDTGGEEIWSRLDMPAIVSGDGKYDLLRIISNDYRIGLGSLVEVSHSFDSVNGTVTVRYLQLSEHSGGMDFSGLMDCMGADICSEGPYFNDMIVLVDKQVVDKMSRCWGTVYDARPEACGKSDLNGNMQVDVYDLILLIDPWVDEWATNFQ
jgi:hypothetical protein